jgi:glycosyltransferase involved in cell wall biosynthesis
MTRKHKGTSNGTRVSKSRICAITYLSKPAHCPPFYHGAISFTKDGHDVFCICLLTDHSPEVHETIAPGFTVRRIALWSREFFFTLFGWPVRFRIASAIQHLFSYIEFVIKAAWRGCRHRGDLYEAHDLPALFPALLAAWPSGAPVVYHAHELYPEMNARVPLAGFWKWLERKLLPRARLVITPDEHRSRILQEEFGARELPLTIHNCPPYSEPISSTDLPDRWRERGVEPSFIMLYQGLIASDRCIEEIITSVERYKPGVVLSLIGHGFGTWASPAEAIPRSDRIDIMPHVRYEDLMKYTASASAGFLFYRNTCRNNYYCAPNKLYEYMMMGLPIITCDYPGLRLVVEGEGIGLCVNPEDPEAIAGAVNRLVSHPDAYATMKANCLRLAKTRYNWEQEFALLRPKYDELLCNMKT